MLFISLLLVIVLDKQQQCKATTAAKNGKRSNGTLRILIASPVMVLLCLRLIPIVKGKEGLDQIYHFQEKSKIFLKKSFKLKN